VPYFEHRVITAKEHSSSMYYLDPHPEKAKSVLLLHGLGTDSSSWQLQLDDLISAGYRPIIPDIPGFGQSSFDNHRWSVKPVTRKIYELVDDLGIAPLSVVGISMGGVIALRFVLDFPEIVDKLVLVNTFATLRIQNLRGWWYFIRRFLLVLGQSREDQANYVVQRVFPDEKNIEVRRQFLDQIMHTDPRIYRQAMIALGLFNVQHQLEKIHCRTLVITGENDTTVPLAGQLNLSRSIIQASHSVVQDAGHAVTIDQPQKFNRILTDFLLTGDLGVTETHR
jgi:3-oxoadipate enol-lactonase